MMFLSSLPETRAVDVVLVAAGGGLHACTCASEPASAVAAIQLRPVKQGCFVPAEHLALVGSMGQRSSSLEGRPSVHIYTVPSLLEKLLFKPEPVSASKTWVSPAIQYKEKPHNPHSAGEGNTSLFL